MFRILAPLLLTLAPGLAAAADSIRVYNWNDYIAPQVLADFTKATGIAVEYHTYASAEELDKILASGESIDIAVPSQNDLPPLIKAGLVQPLDMSRLPNRKHLDKQLLSKLAAVDPQNRYAVPYLWGAVGLAINTPQAEAAYGGPLPSSWSLLFDPAQSSKLASCGVSVLDAPDEMFYNLLSYQGRSLTNSSPGRLRKAGEALMGLRPNLRYVDSERYIDDLNQGRLCVAVAWVGDALGASDTGQPVQFVVPEEGSTLFIDNLVIPSSARRADLAHQFIDYLMQPQVAAQISSETLYPSANLGAQQFLEPKLREQLGRNLDSAKNRLFALMPLSDKLKSARDETWTRFRDGS
ncbi:extracellular solute-binding protein [Aquipseudomonas alcaligenes]|uniref:Putrescine-binding periplasmic protein n=1 Tax=Aquipseudomonas alcaligenes (strain ATCC 14909 / DSM 50342 / CCUG 1425 / JCM 20561 / NBRC 14159 / NCIMB 9945 / NCTC 10367 / 1577) TaxID=1215092 RepID=U2ZHQ2_AQUA1|nr:extracellular solute-binding protein [Pseudomonas alcaligenes]GAD61005.1 putative ABC transporter substrate-binding protein [Pseudomonas alcaligenes NBRC 14159]SUD13475.1 extracellular solute-binding protein [Pseudomonas alcaligenes]